MGSARRSLEHLDRIGDGAMVEMRLLNLLRGRRLLRRSSVWHPVDLCNRTQEGDDDDDDDERMVGDVTGMSLFQRNEISETQTAPVETTCLILANHDI